MKQYDDSDNEVGDDLGLAADPLETKFVERVRSRSRYYASIWATAGLLVSIVLFFYLRRLLGY